MPLTFWIEFPFFTKYREHLKISAVFQVFIIFLSAIVLDGGYLCQFMVLSALTYWLIAAVIMIQRDNYATRFDRFLLMCGYLVAIPLTAAIGAIVPVGALRHH